MSEKNAEVLNLHRVSPRCFDLTSVRTGSVRDQLIRSSLLVSGLVASELLCSPRRQVDDHMKRAIACMTRESVFLCSVRVPLASPLRWAPLSKGQM